MNKKCQKASPQHYRLRLKEGLIDCNNFWRKYFWHNCLSNDGFSFHLI